jgi:acetolactate synthase I/II/III large subunit
MNGAESLVRTLLANDVVVCFANPGTSEMHFVGALDRVPGVRCALVLFEGVATGAADGYARLTGKPAATLLHCGPGLANGLANLHNAHRAGVPIVNIVGDQATYHRPFAPPLAADTEGWARSVSSWTRVAQSSETVGADAAAAVQAARTNNDVATLILPSDTSWNEGGAPAGRLAIAPKTSVAAATISACAGVLRSGEPVALLVGGAALEHETGLRDAHRIAVATGARLMAPTFNRRILRGQGRPAIPLVPYVVERAVAALAGIRHLILVDCDQPVGFFAYPGKPSVMQPEGTAVHVLARRNEDSVEALARLAAELHLAPPGVRLATAGSERPRFERGPLTSQGVAQTLAALLPEQAVVIDESVSFGFALYPGTHCAAPHDWLQLCGGAIGEGMPLATGAAIAAPGRRVIDLEGDGSALYDVQALWTQAREQLDVTTIIFSNRKYAILEMELRNVGANPGRTALDLFDLQKPPVDWVAVARGMGVEAASATSLQQLADLLTASNGRKGPFLIEVVVG